jgi:hypothetical protein
MHFTADLLYWQAKENGLEPYFTKTAVREPSFKWDPGFRVGFGTSLPHDKWDLSLLFTHLHTKAFVPFHSDPSPLFPSWTEKLAAAPAFVDEARLRWRLHLGLLDLDLMRCFEATRRLTFHLGLNLRTAWIRQKLKVIYRGGALFPGDEDELSAKNKFWGIGPGIKASSLFDVWKGWSLLGKGAFALLQGEFYVHQDEDSELEEFLKIHSVYTGSAPIVELGLGIQKKFGKNLVVNLIWEELFLWGQNRLLHFLNGSSSAANQGDLTLQGITLGISARF